jgi:hypothetical protein
MRKRPFILVVLPWLVASGCASGRAPPGNAPQEFKITATPSQRLRFDINFTPYADEMSPSIPSHERIRLGMRRFAAEKLKEAGLCPHGFDGPDMVLVPERGPRDKGFFFVKCVEPNVR